MSKKVEHYGRRSDFNERGSKMNDSSKQIKSPKSRRSNNGSFNNSFLAIEKKIFPSMASEEMKYDELNEEEKISKVTLKRYATKLSLPELAGRVLSACFYISQDERKRYLITGGDRNVLVIWDLMDGTLVAKLETKHSKEITCVAAYSPIEQLSDHHPVLLAADSSGSVSAWNLSTHKMMYMQECHKKGINAIEVYKPTDNSDTLFITGSIDKTARMWDIQSGHTLGILEDQQNGHLDQILSIALYIPKEGIDAAPLCITASWDKTVIIWNLETRTMVKKLVGHIKSCTSVTVFDLVDGTSPVIITTSLDMTVIVWDLKTYEQIRVLKDIHKERISSAAVIRGSYCSPPMVVTCSDDQTAVIFDLLTGAIVRTLKGVHSAKLNKVLTYLHPLGSLIVTVGDDSNTVIWNLTKRERSRKLLSNGRCTDQSKCAAVTSLTTFYPRENEDFQPAVVVGYIDGQVIAFDIAKSTRIRQFQFDQIRINCVVVHSPRDLAKPTFVVACNGDRSVIVWNLLNQHLVHRFIEELLPPMSLCVYEPDDPTESTLVISGCIDKTIKCWDLYSHQRKGTTLVGHQGMVRSMALYNPGKNRTPFLVSGSYDRSVIVWNLREFKEEKRLKGQHTDYIFAVAVYDPMKSGQNPTEKHPPLVVSASYDSTTVIWNMLTGAALRTLRGHADSVTALHLFVPYDGTSPLVLTGSIDKTIVVWDMNTGEELERLTGHEDRLMSIAVFAPSPEENPIMISGSDDKSTILWEDTLYPFRTMPLHDIVMESFDFDLQEENWPLITKLATEFGIGLFIENTLLFHRAIEKGRSDFLARFKPMLTYCLRFVNQKVFQDPDSTVESTPELATAAMRAQSFKSNRSSDDYSHENLMLVSNKTTAVNEKVVRSLLECALKKSDLDSVRIIHECWTENLNVDIADILTQRLYHASYFFHKNDLIQFAEMYPVEFSRFVCSLHLVKTHKSVKSEDIVSYNIKTNSKTLIKRCDDKAAGNLWNSNSMVGNLNDNQGQPVTALFLPLRYPSHNSLLKVYVQVCRELDSVEIFDSDIGITVLNFVWDDYGQKAHVRAASVYAVFLVIFTFSAYIFNQFENGTAGYFTGWVFQLFVLLALLYYSYEEVIQMHTNRLNVIINKDSLGSYSLGMLAHVRDFWNLIDMVILLLCGAGFILRIYYDQDTVESRCLLAGASIFVWFKVLYFMRPFADSGPLVCIIIQISNDIKYLLLVLGVMLVGFAQAFWLLSDTYAPSDKSYFGSVQQSFLNCFLFMLGHDIDINFADESASPVFSTLLLVVFLSFMMILMLNMLIAQMGDSYTKVRQRGFGQWRLEQASIILEQWFRLDDSKIDQPPFLHVMRYTQKLERNNSSCMHVLKQIDNHLTFLNDNMMNYSVYDVALKTNTLNEKLDRTKDSIGDMQNELTNMEKRLKQHTQISKKSVGGKLESAMKTLELKLDTLQDMLSRSREQTSQSNELRTIQSSVRSNDIDMQMNVLNNRVNNIEYRISSIDDKLNAILQRLR